MSLTPINANSGAVTAIAEDALVLALASGGGYAPVTFADLAKALKGQLGMYRETNLSLTGGEWVRVAKTNAVGALFGAILTVSHIWSSGRPTPLVCFINGASGNEVGYLAEQLTESSSYFQSVSNQGLSFTHVRFVKETDAVYIEVKFKDTGARTNMVCCSLGNNMNLVLIPATVSSVSEDKVQKTIEFDLRGG